MRWNFSGLTEPADMVYCEAKVMLSATFSRFFWLDRKFITWGLVLILRSTKLLGPVYYLFSGC